MLLAGTKMTGGAEIQRELVSGRSKLARAGVVMCRGDSADRWHAAARRALDQRRSVRPRRPIFGRGRRRAEVLLLASDEVEGRLASEEALTPLVGLASRYRAAPKVVVIVREQLGYLNRVYCERVLQLRTAEDFASFVASALWWSRFDYLAHLRAVLESPDVQFLAVPYSRLDHTRPAESFLKAIGVEANMGCVNEDAERQQDPGPTLIAATRLLHKRLRRRGAFEVRGRTGLLPLVNQLRECADAGGWDDDAFWGWTPDLAAEAVAFYETSNDEFARRVWGEAWSEPWTQRAPRAGSVIDTEPSIVAEVTDTIQRLVLESVAQAERGR